MLGDRYTRASARRSLQQIDPGLEATRAHLTAQLGGDEPFIGERAAQALDYLQQVPTR